jgi:plastocyanin
VAASIVATVTDEAGKKLADAVVLVRPLPGTAIPPADRTRLATATIDQVNEMFVPTVVVLGVGGSVTFHNGDQTRHHVYSFAPIRQFEMVENPGDTEAVRFDTAGSAAIGCNIHDQMVAYVYVTDAPWAAVTDQDGRATIADLPAGGFTATVWHPRLRPSAAPPIETIQLATATTTLSISLPVVPPRRRRSVNSFY